MERKNIFTKSDTLLIKGGAIILMVCNHLFPIPEWIYPENRFISLAIGDKTLAEYFGGFSKVCVAIFALLTGIAMFYTYSKGSLFCAYRHTLKKLPRFFLTYWLILFTIYIPVIGIFGGDTSITIKDILWNLSGYETTYCKIAWYVRFYFELIISFPAIVYAYINIKRIFRFDKTGICVLLGIMLLDFLANNISHLMPTTLTYFVDEYLFYLQVVIVGFYIAEKNLFYHAAVHMNNYSQTFQNFLSITLFVLCFLSRGLLKQIGYLNLDCIYAPAVVFLAWNFLRRYSLSNFKQILTFLGRYSLEIWFLHAIFFIGNAAVQHFAYWPKISVLILVWVLLILSPVAALEQKIVNKAFEIGKTIFTHSFRV